MSVIAHFAKRDIKRAVLGAEVITAATTLTAANSGATYFINSATGRVITLPAPELGLRFKFIVGATPPTSGGHTIVTSGSANIFKGGTVASDAMAGDTGTTDDTITFVASTCVAGDFVELICDGTNWYVFGYADDADHITLTTAS